MSSSRLRSFSTIIRKAASLLKKLGAFTGSPYTVWRNTRRGRLKHTDEAVAHVNGIDIAYDTFGNAAYPPILLIMGFSSQMIFWEDDFCMKFAERKFRVIRFDNRDTGDSERLDMLTAENFRNLLEGKAVNTPYTLHDMSDDAAGLLDELGIPSAHIVGASMGGMIAQLLALEHPEKVRTLTVIMSSTGNPLLPPPRPEALKEFYQPFPMRKEEFIERFTKAWHTLNGDELSIDDARIRKLAERTFERGVSPVASIRQLLAVSASGSRKTRLGSLQIPTLVIHGKIDPLLPVECGIDLAESIPGSRFKLIDGMGHALPPAVWDEIIGAIAEHTQSPGRKRVR